MYLGKENKQLTINIKYHSLTVIVPTVFLFNLGMSVLTLIIIIKIRKDRMKKSNDKSKDQQKNSKDQNDSLKQVFEYCLICATLISLYGIVYLVHHGFWIIIALLAYPGRITTSYNY